MKYQTLIRAALALLAAVVASVFLMPDFSGVFKYINWKLAKDILESISFLTAPIIAVIAWRGLRQIEVTRKIAATQAKREAFRIAAEQIDDFAVRAIPLTNEFHRLKGEGKYPVFSSIKCEESWPDIKFECNDPSGTGAGIRAEISSNDGLIIRIANRLEGFAVFFTAGIADAKVAYYPISSIFCDTVRSILPYLIEAHQQHNQFTHTLQLYMQWAVQRMKTQTEKEVAAKQAQLGKITIPPIKPIGT